MQMLVMHKKPMQSGPLQKNSKCKFGANAILYNAMLGSANVANVIQSLQSWNQPFRPVFNTKSEIGHKNCFFLERR